MKKSIAKPYSLLLFVLAVIVAFFIGISIARITGAGKNQGLAGGAIILFHGIIASLFAFITALIISIKANRKLIINLNKILVLIILLFTSYITWNYYTNIKPERDGQTIEAPKKEPTTVSYHNNYFSNLILG